MKCKSCESDMFIGPSGFTTEIGTEDVKLIQSVYCPSIKCSMYKKLIRTEHDAPKPPVFEE